MNRLRALLARLKANASTIAVMLIGLSILLLLFAAVDLVFRHALGLPKDVAAYLSLLTVVVLLTVFLKRWPAGARTVEEEEN